MKSERISDPADFRSPAAAKVGISDIDVAQLKQRLALPGDDGDSRAE